VCTCIAPIATTRKSLALEAEDSNALRHVGITAHFYAFVNHTETGSKLVLNSDGNQEPSILLSLILKKIGREDRKSMELVQYSVQGGIWF
jgi:hypothetical protein